MFTLIAFSVISTVLFAYADQSRSKREVAILIHHD